MISRRLHRTATKTLASYCYQDDNNRANTPAVTTIADASTVLLQDKRHHVKTRGLDNKAWGQAFLEGGSNVTAWPGMVTWLAWGLGAHEEHI